MTNNIPAAVAVSTAALGVIAAVAGVYVLAGFGWALVAGSIPLLTTSAVTFRGLLRGTE